jgi:hypothetical protein
MAQGPRVQGQGQGPERAHQLQEDQRGPKSEYAILTTPSGPSQNSNTLQRPSYGEEGQTTDQGGREFGTTQGLPAMQRKTARNAAVFMVVVVMARERKILSQSWLSMTAGCCGRGGRGVCVRQLRA